MNNYQDYLSFCKINNLQTGTIVSYLEFNAKRSK